jgi:uncharacterized protein
VVILLATSDLRRVLTFGPDLTHVVDQTSTAPPVWLFDKVGSIEGWTTVLKSGRGGTPFGDDTVVTTGSRWSTNDDVEGNLLTGRAGSANSGCVRQSVQVSVTTGQHRPRRTGLASHVRRDRSLARRGETP